MVDWQEIPQQVIQQSEIIIKILVLLALKIIGVEWGLENQVCVILAVAGAAGFILVVIPQKAAVVLQE
jgi:hypothetical protein